MRTRTATTIWTSLDGFRALTGVDDEVTFTREEIMAARSNGRRHRRPARRAAAQL